MSKERQRSRAARQAARADDAERAARARASQRRTRRRKAAVQRTLNRTLDRSPRRRRYGAMPRRTQLALFAGWLAVQAVGWQLLEAWTQRLGLALLSLLALPLVITLWLSPRSKR